MPSDDNNGRDLTQDAPAPPANELPPRIEDILDQALAEADSADDEPAAGEGVDDAPWAKSDADLMREEMERSLAGGQFGRSTRLRRGDKVTGTVVHVGQSDIFVDIGGKSEALLDVAELSSGDDEIEVRKGDTLTLYVSEAGSDGVRLSHKMALAARSREAVRSAYADHVPLEGRIAAKRKGGFDVKFSSGQRAFLPLSQVELRHVPDEELDEYVGKTFQFLITKYESDGRDLVVSRSQLLREEREEARGELQATLQEGQVREGTVSRVVDFGAFVDLGGMDGLVHVSEIQWGYSERPQEKLRIGEKVRVKVLRVDQAKGTVSLSIREAEGSPWDRVGTDFVEGGVYPGIVRRIEPFGAFVELAPGLDGLVHVSELSWERVKHPDALVHKGDHVTVKLVRLEPERRRIGLSMKLVGGDPWTDIAPGWLRGQLLDGTVEKVAPFGVLVRIAPGISGLIPFGDLGMDQAQAHLAYQAEKSVTVEVGDVDLERRRVRLLPSDEKARDERAALEDYSSNTEAGGLGTLGDLLGKLKLD